MIEGRFVPGEWCIEILNEDGGYEAVAFFRGPKAREQANAYARDRFGEFDETLTDDDPAVMLTATAGDLRRGKLAAPRRAVRRRGSRPNSSAQRT